MLSLQSGDSRNPSLVADVHGALSSVHIPVLVLSRCYPIYSCNKPVRRTLLPLSPVRRPGSGREGSSQSQEVLGWLPTAVWCCSPCRAVTGLPGAGGHWRLFLAAPPSPPKASSPILGNGSHGCPHSLSWTEGEPGGSGSCPGDSGLTCRPLPCCSFCSSSWECWCPS